MDPEIAAFERMAAQHWQGTERARLGGWLLRAAGGFTGRANSALPLGDPGMPVERAVDEVHAWYTQRGLPPLIALPMWPDASPGPLETLLIQRGWRLRAGPAVVMTARTGLIADHRQDAGLAYAAEPDAEWLALYRFHGQPVPQAALPVLLSAPEQVFGSLRRDGHTVATGRLSLAGGWAGITGVEVAPAWRRAGLGTAITAGLAAQAAARGVQDIFLQVEEDNAAARALYTRCGFTGRHRYHYRLAPAGS
ncbi:MAG TPA: GNAT family N-acetyltransferase [Streptosporangiaceae bacterium]